MVTTFDNHPCIQRVLDVIKEDRRISVELEIINEASFKTDHHYKKLCKCCNNNDQEKVQILNIRKIAPFNETIDMSTHNDITCVVRSVDKMRPNTSSEVQTIYFY